MGIGGFQIVILVFLLFSAIFYIILKILERGEKSVKNGKSKVYACGEEMKAEYLNIPSESFHRILSKVLMLEKLKKIHSGELGIYIGWILIGMILIIIYVMNVW